MRTVSGVLGGVLVAGIVTVGVPAAANTTGPVAPEQRKSANAVKVLNGLTVKGERNAGYDRAKFTHWTTMGGCDTRVRVLKAESTSPTSTTSSCTVVTGSWFSAYDGITTSNPSDFDIDHMVPLAEAWGSGAKTWNAATRKAFANDTGYAGSLIAVTASSNRSKSDRDPAEWMPPASSYRCTYAKTWIAVKYRWGLSVDKTEKRTLKRIVKSECASKSVALPAKAKVTTGGASASKPSKPSGPSTVYFKNCDAARAAGAAPVYASDPGYGRHLDRDGDGVACE